MKDYEVGYGKPPKDSQFKKGESGNPRGRMKNTRNLKTDLTKILEKRISVRDGERKFKVSGQEGMLMSLMSKCLKGDTKAINTLINLVVRISGLEGSAPNVAERLTPEEQVMIAEFDDRLRNLLQGGEPANDSEKSEDPA